MNRSHTLAKALVVATSLFVASLTSQATSVINITVSGGSLVTDAPKSDLGDFGDGTVLTWLTADVIAYKGITGIALPPPVANNPLDKVNTGSGPLSLNLNLNNTFDYIFLHWGSSGGGVAQAFYIGGVTGPVEFDVPADGNSLSSYTLYGPTPSSHVPDGGNTLIMFGLACIGAVGIRRFVGARSLR